MPVSTSRRKSFILRSITRSPFGSSIRRTHLFAWPCGSTISGQRLQRVTITPFSVEKLSAGSPCSCQPRTSTARAQNCANVCASVNGSVFSFTSVSHPAWGGGKTAHSLFTGYRQ